MYIINSIHLNNRWWSAIVHCLLKQNEDTCRIRGWKETGERLNSRRQERDTIFRNVFRVFVTRKCTVRLIQFASAQISRLVRSGAKIHSNVRNVLSHIYPFSSTRRSVLRLFAAHQRRPEAPLRGNRTLGVFMHIFVEKLCLRVICPFYTFPL